MQNFFTSLGAVGTMARANKNQQSPKAPWMITFAVAPPTKNWGFVSHDERRQGRDFHCFVWLDSTSICSCHSPSRIWCLCGFNIRLCCIKGDYDGLFVLLNFPFFSRQSLVMRSTLALQSSMAFSSSLVTRKPTCSSASSKRNSGHSARRLHSHNNARRYRHVLKEGYSVIVAESFICFNINV